MLRLRKAYRPDATVRAIWSDNLGPELRRAGAFPRRASRVEVIESGPHRGKFHVDLSLMAALTGDHRFAVCLARPFESHADAVAAEVEFLERAWLTATSPAPHM